jgi:hypothetical protein
MILTHHLALLGINKNAETKQYTDLVKLSNEKSNSSKKETEDTEETQETTDENELEEPSSSVELKKNKKK